MEKTLKNWTLIVYFNKPWYEEDYRWHGNLKIGLFSPEAIQKEIHLNPWTVRGAGDIMLLNEVIKENSPLSNYKPMQAVEEIYTKLTEEWADKSIIQEGWTKEDIIKRCESTLKGKWFFPDHAMIEEFRAKSLYDGIEGLVETLKQTYKLRNGG
ncbi:hypothetical protein FJZ53_03115 [Candidatus Woesearchaeota archaeon]|nr:hypothetical protein [Candidatus Woesearchaeota archaeon]